METDYNKELLQKQAENALEQFYHEINSRDSEVIIDAFKQAYKDLHVKLKKAEQERDQWRDRANKWQ